MCLFVFGVGYFFKVIVEVVSCWFDWIGGIIWFVEKVEQFKVVGIEFFLFDGEMVSIEIDDVLVYVIYVLILIVLNEGGDFVFNIF